MSSSGSPDDDNAQRREEREKKGEMESKLIEFSITAPHFGNLSLSTTSSDLPLQMISSFLNAAKGISVEKNTPRVRAIPSAPTKKAILPPVTVLQVGQDSDKDKEDAGSDEEYQASDKEKRKAIKIWRKKEIKALEDYSKRASENSTTPPTVQTIPDQSPSAPPPCRSLPIQVAVQDSPNTNEEYAVVKVRKSRFKNGVFEFYTHWESGERSWEPFENFGKLDHEKLKEYYAHNSKEFMNNLHECMTGQPPVGLGWQLVEQAPTPPTQAVKASQIVKQTESVQAVQPNRSNQSATSSMKNGLENKRHLNTNDVESNQKKARNDGEKDSKWTKSQYIVSSKPTQTLTTPIKLIPRGKIVEREQTTVNSLTKG